MTHAEFAALFKLSPAEAATYMQGREDLAPTFSWQDLWQEEHAQQFTVSRLTRLDLLSAVQAALEAAVQGDLNRSDWMAGMEAALKGAGWWGSIELTDPATGDTVTTKFNENRLKLIFDTNVRMANSAGRWERFQRTRGTHAYVRYITKRDERVRAAHRAWDNLTLPIDAPFWHTHWPPNGWRCRCRVMAVSRRDYENGLAPDGRPLQKTAPSAAMRAWVNKRTGEITRLPEGIDPGFGYNVGDVAARAQQRNQLIQDKLAQAPPNLADAARRDGLSEG